MPLSLPFYVLYAAAGLSDILDGFIDGKQIPQPNSARSSIPLQISFLPQSL
ncbi:MAG: hypothetical protein UHG68_10700 [Clostridia bacterium]|nr:hypothetical protein [Clostridia bacterium]